MYWSTSALNAISNMRSAFSYQFVQVQFERILFGLIRGDYSQHAAYLWAALQPPRVVNNQEGTPRSPRPHRSTTYVYISIKALPAAQFQGAVSLQRRVVATMCRVFDRLRTVAA